jgi:ribonuclease HII
MIVGIDEVGRGAWAGPLCVAAAAIGHEEFPGLTDSKKLSIKKRTFFDADIKRRAPLVGIGWVSARDIDRIGMSQALKLAAKRAFVQIDCPEVSQIIIDGTIMLLDDPRAVTMKQADLLVPSVSAASVIAKVARDDYMASLAELFPGYGFEKHVGYGTSMHMAALSEKGATPIHRMSFAPLKGSTQVPSVVSVQSDGSKAEDIMAKHLESHGYEVIDRNWKTKWCEIDIIATKAGRVHFIEVKYRRNSTYGDGLAAITPKKQRQMRFAAELWLSRHDPDSAVLSVASLSGDTFSVDELIELTF